MYNLCSVSDRLRIFNGGLRFVPDWKKGISTVKEISEMQDVLFLLRDASISDCKDTWFWGEEAKGTYSVALMKSMIREEEEVRRDFCMRWESWIPIKVNIFVWRTEMDRIPTRMALSRRRLNVGDSSCTLCGIGDEDVMHLFTGCVFSFGVWSIVG
ncbi:putative reverse transcriptase zinc-binding domain-containing protein [Helianthus annuus]|nr:putative reverse transcriptase zinc-binding domain-containing protein [Helianthus annuus]